MQTNKEQPVTPLTIYLDSQVASSIVYADRHYLLTMGEVTEQDLPPSTGDYVRIVSTEGQPISELDQEGWPTQQFGTRVLLLNKQARSETVSEETKLSTVCRVINPSQILSKVRLSMVIREKPATWLNSVYRISYQIDSPRLLECLINKNFVFHDAFPYFYSPEPSGIEQDFTILLSEDPKASLGGRRGVLEAGKKVWGDVEDKLQNIHHLSSLKDLPEASQTITIVLKRNQDCLQWTLSSKLSDEEKAQPELKAFNINEDIDTVYEVTVFLGKSFVQVRQANIKPVETGTWQPAVGAYLGKLGQKKVLDKKIISSVEVDNLSADICKLSGSKFFSYQFVKSSGFEHPVLINFENLPDYSRTPILTKVLEEYLASRMVKRSVVKRSARKIESVINSS